MNQEETGRHVTSRRITMKRERSRGWDCVVNDDLKKLISTTYTNKMHILFDSLSHKKPIVKHVWIEVVM